MTPQIVCFDTETTGLDVQNDSIIQLSLVKFDSATFVEIEALDWYIMPSVPFVIAPAAEAVHHISREILEQQGVSLKEVYPQLVAFVEGCDILSYNGNGFDARILYYNLLREGLSFDFDKHIFYDAYIIETARTSRRLGDVYRRYYGHDFEDAHNSLADVRATIAVFQKQVELCKAEGMDVHFPEFDFVSVDGFLALKEGHFVLAQGKYRGRTVTEIAKEDASYMDWVCKTCAAPTRQYIIRELMPRPAKSAHTPATAATAAPAATTEPFTPIPASTTPVATAVQTISSATKDTPLKPATPAPAKHPTHKKDAKTKKGGGSDDQQMSLF